MASSTNLLGAGSPLLPSSAPNPTTAATDLAAVVVPLPCDSDRGIDPAAGALCQVRSNERDGLAAAGETSGGGFFPALAGGLSLVLAGIGIALAVRWFLLRARFRRLLSSALASRIRYAPRFEVEHAKDGAKSLFRATCYLIAPDNSLAASGTGLGSTELQAKNRALLMARMMAEFARQAEVEDGDGGAFS